MTLKWDGHGATIPDPVTPVFGNPGEPLLQAEHPIGFSGGLPEPQTPDPDSEGSVQSPINENSIWPFVIAPKGVDSARIKGTYPFWGSPRATPLGHFPLYLPLWHEARPGSRCFC